MGEGDNYAVGSVISAMSVPCKLQLRPVVVLPDEDSFNRLALEWLSKEDQAFIDSQKVPLIKRPYSGLRLNGVKVAHMRTGAPFKLRKNFCGACTIDTPKKKARPPRARCDTKMANTTARKKSVNTKQKTLQPTQLANPKQQNMQSPTKLFNIKKQIMKSPTKRANTKQKKMKIPSKLTNATDDDFELYCTDVVLDDLKMKMKVVRVKTSKRSKRRRPPVAPLLPAPSVPDRGMKLTDFVARLKRDDPSTSADVKTYLQNLVARRPNEPPATNQSEHGLSADKTSFSSVRRKAYAMEVKRKHAVYVAQLESRIIGLEEQARHHAAAVNEARGETYRRVVRKGRKEVEKLKILFDRSTEDLVNDFTKVLVQHTARCRQLFTSCVGIKN